MRFRFWSAILAAVVATIIMTFVLWLLGINLLLALGTTAGMTGGMAYFIGAIIHLIVGIFWGLVYAIIFEPWMKRLPGFLSGAIFSLLPFVLAITLMGTFLDTIRAIFGVEKDSRMERCYPGRSSMKCRPFSMAANDGDCYPMLRSEPCPDKERKPEGRRGRSRQRMRDCRPSDDRGYPSGMLRDKKPCHPCGPRGEAPNWLWSLITHLIYGIFLGLIYQPRKTKKI